MKQNPEIAIVYNEQSGNGKWKRLKARIVKMLSQESYKVELFNILDLNETQKRELLKDGNKSIIITAGGDGTLSSFERDVMKYNPNQVISHLPTGSTNDLSNKFAYNEKSTLKILKEILTGEVYETDVCTINNEVWNYIAALGTIPSVTYSTPQQQKKVLKKFAYFINAAQKITSDGFNLYDVEYKINGKTYQETCSNILISNAPGFGGFRKIFRKANFSDRQFEATFITAKNIKEAKELLKSLCYSSDKDLNNVAHVKNFTTQKVELTFKSCPLDNWSLDGEKYQEKDERVTFGMYPKKLKFQVPRRSKGKLQGI